MLKTTETNIPRTKPKRRWTSFLALLILLASLGGSIYDYARRNDRLVKADIYQTLGEAAQQQLMLLDTKVDDLFSHLGFLADSADMADGLDPDLIGAMDLSMELYGFRTMGLIDAAGAACLRSGECFDASGRDYFIRALAGGRAVEYIEDNMLTGEKVFALSVPVYDGDAVGGVLFAIYDSQDFAELLETTAFDGRSYSYITETDGRIIISPNHPSALVSGGNLLTSAAKDVPEKGVTAELVAERMRNGESFTFKITASGGDRYISFMPAGINDWVLFYVATDEVAAERASASARLVYPLALKLLLIFAIFAFILWRYESRRRSDVLLREEELRAAAGQSGKLILRYDIQKKTIAFVAGHTPNSSALYTFTENVPESIVAAGLVTEDSVGDLLAFFEAMSGGEEQGSATCRMLGDDGGHVWLRAAYTLVAGEKKARYAVISLSDVTKQREQESIYEKWRQSILDRAPESYTLFHCTIGRETSMDTREGALLNVSFEPGPFEFDAHTQQYAARCVFDEDREKLTAFLTTDALLFSYYHGNRIVSLDYRERTPESGFRWLRLTVELVEQAHSSDIEAYLLFEDVDGQKRAELEILERAETDPLTGLLNRAAFARRVDGLIHAAGPGALHALLMIDIDNFKLVNDSLGHGAGDRALTDIAELLSGGSRRGDLVGRLGGDEFVVFLPGISDAAAAGGKAHQICELTRISPGDGVRISGSVGIALCPEDGDEFETLYKKADAALYRVKATGKNSYAFYRGEEL